MPGQGLAFCYNKDTFQTKVYSYPNKNMKVQAQGFMFRSDSNSEDLPGFAGAGLFDSYSMNDEKRVRCSYNKEKLIVDDNFRN